MSGHRYRHISMDETRQQLEAHRAVGDKLVLVVPSYQMPLVPQSAERVDRFRQNLERAMSSAVAGETDVTPVVGPSEPVERHTDDPRLVVINACMTCRGACCEHGGDEAYLDAKFLASRLANEPEREPASIVAEYLDQIPEQSIAGSCVFHGQQGCVLSRETRSRTCNEFLCYPLQEHEQKSDSAVNGSVAVAKHRGKFQRAAWMEPDGSRVEIELR